MVLFKLKHFLILFSLQNISMNAVDTHNFLIMHICACNCLLLCILGNFISTSSSPLFSTIVRPLLQFYRPILVQFYTISSIRVILLPQNEQVPFSPFLPVSPSLSFYACAASVTMTGGTKPINNRKGHHGSKTKTTLSASERLRPITRSRYFNTLYHRPEQSRTVFFGIHNQDRYFPCVVTITNIITCDYNHPHTTLQYNDIYYLALTSIVAVEIFTKSTKGHFDMDRLFCQVVMTTITVKTRC